MGLSIDSLELGHSVDGPTLFTLQPRAYEGCFSSVDEQGNIDVYLIQDQMLPWLLAFFDHDLNIAFDVIDGIPLLTLRYRHFQVTFPVYGDVPTSGRLRLCIIELDGLKVLRINRHELKKRMSEALADAVKSLMISDSDTLYTRFDAIKAKGLETERSDKALTDVLKSL